VKHDWIAGGFDAQHRLCQQITSNPGNDIFDPHSAIGAVAVSAIAELPVGAVRKHHRAVPGIEQFGSGEGVGELAAAWQFQEQKIAAAFECHRQLTIRPRRCTAVEAA